MLHDTRLESPNEYPPEASKQLQQRADDLKKELLKQLGYHVRQRIRNSPLVPAAEILRADETPLPGRGICEIVDDIWGEDDSGLDQERQKLTKSRRQNVQKRLSALKDPPAQTSGDAKL